MGKQWAIYTKNPIVQPDAHATSHPPHRSYGSFSFFASESNLWLDSPCGDEKLCLFMRISRPDGEICKSIRKEYNMLSSKGVNHGQPAHEVEYILRMGW